MKGRWAGFMLLATVIAGCGSTVKKDLVRDLGRTRTAPAAIGAAPVIRGWADALRAGDTRHAAAYFALPSVAENGPPAIRIRSREDAELFNISLPCGARLLGVKSSGRYAIATFRLVKRPGGDCGDGVGQKARTRFLVRNGQIIEWRRVPMAGDRPPVGTPA
jgi:hypothetical protein